MKDIRNLGARPAIALNPDTPVSDVFNFLEHLDMVLIMSVFPGFGGQKFIEETYDRVNELRGYCTINDLDILIQVDGGVSEVNIKKLEECGVDVMVVGSVIFKADDPVDTISNLKSLIS